MLDQKFVDEMRRAKRLEAAQQLDHESDTC